MPRFVQKKISQQLVSEFVQKNILAVGWLGNLLVKGPDAVRRLHAGQWANGTGIDFRLTTAKVQTSST